MRIQEAEIHLSSRHEEERRHSFETRGFSSFRTVLRDVSVREPETIPGDRERLGNLLQLLVDAILAALEGKKCRTEIAAEEARVPPRRVRQVEREVVWQWESTETFSEHERTQVEGSGTIRTADGKIIDFKMNLELCRDYSCLRTVENSGKVVLRDPLVINFGGKAAALTADRFDFDLDADGKVESIPGLGSGSGYLVLDRNGNQRVDDGSELFGTASGDGFADLALLDSDGNGWLDEADPAFAELRIWEGGKGAGELTGLGQKGVGALWLSSVNSPFALKDPANQLLGEIRASGLYLCEDGKVGCLQQVDLAFLPEGTGTEEAVRS